MPSVTLSNPGHLLALRGSRLSATYSSLTPYHKVYYSLGEQALQCKKNPGVGWTCVPYLWSSRSQRCLDQPGYIIWTSRYLPHPVGSTIKGGEIRRVRAILLGRCPRDRVRYLEELCQNESWLDHNNLDSKRRQLAPHTVRNRLKCVFRRIVNR